MEQNVFLTKMIGIIVAVIVAAVVLIPICNSLTEGDGGNGGDEGNLVFTTADFASINTEGMEAEQVLFSITGNVTSAIEGDAIADSRGVSVIVKERDGSLVPYWQMVDAGPMSSGVYDGYIATTPFDNPPNCVWDINIEVDEGARTANVSIKTNMGSEPLDEVTPTACTISGIELTYDSSVISSSSSGSSDGGNDLGTTGTLIKTIPIFVILAILMGAAGLFYQNRKAI